MFPDFRLISHVLCPYVQRAVIVASEHSIPFERVDIDLGDKPGWFLAISPTGKVPLIEVAGADGKATILFESAVIAEYLDELSGTPLLPGDPLDRARHRAWIEFASATLATIGELYSATDLDGFERATAKLADRLGHIESAIARPWFDGARFGLVDAAFAPAFRYLDVFRTYGGLDLFAGFPMADAWARRLAGRPSVRGATSPDYPDLLVNFIAGRGSFLGRLLENALLEA